MKRTARIPQQPRKNTRLRGYDYSLPGAYFITIVSKNRDLIFEDMNMKTVVEEAWQWLGRTFSDVELDAFVVMPNHIHCVLMITERSQGRWQAAPTALWRFADADVDSRGLRPSAADCRRCTREYD